MKLLCFGSLNIDHVYDLDHIVMPGETITSNAYNLNCGGKGLNQAIAMSKAGLDVWMGGLIGTDGEELRKELEKNGVNTDHVKVSRVRSGNAIIQVDKGGQNCIVLFPGANREVTPEFVDEVLKDFDKGDYLVLQNEISNLDYIIKKAGEKGMVISLNPSPFDSRISECDLTKISYFFVNEVEGEQLTGQKEPEKILDAMLSKFPDSGIILTLGGDGSCYGDKNERHKQAIFKVDAVDTTAAGDTFSGYFLSAMSEGLPKDECLRRASAASAIAVTRKGAGASIPSPGEVEEFLKQQD